MESCVAHQDYLVDPSTKRLVDRPVGMSPWHKTTILADSDYMQF